MVESELNELPVADAKISDFCTVTAFIRVVDLVAALVTCRLLWRMPTIA